MTETLPQEITRELINILMTSDKAQLLLKGYLTGKGIQGKITVSGDITISSE